jgi:guanine nucleotide-binding protein G(I)/G(S)/G(T) subunit beta-1
VSGSSDSTAKVWDIRQGNSVATFKGHVSDINSVQWFPDGQPNTFASGSDDASVRLFDMRAFREINIYAYEQMFDAVCCVDFSLSGYYLIAGYDEEPYCLVWDVMHATRVKTLEHPKRASCLQVSPNGYCVATGSWDKMVRIWS